MCGCSEGGKEALSRDGERLQALFGGMPQYVACADVVRHVPLTLVAVAEPFLRTLSGAFGCGAVFKAHECGLAVKARVNDLIRSEGDDQPVLSGLAPVRHLPFRLALVGIGERDVLEAEG